MKHSIFLIGLILIILSVSPACKQAKNPMAQVLVLIDSNSKPAVNANVRIFSTGANGPSTALNINKKLTTDGTGVVLFEVDNDVVVQCYCTLPYKSDSLRGQRTLVINTDRKNETDTLTVRIR